MADARELLLRTFSRVRDQPDREVSARTVARSTTIIGLMLEGIAERRRVSKEPGAIVARFGRVVWGLVELSAPQSLWRVFGRHWISLLYAIGILMAIGGYIAGTPAVAGAGLRVVGITVLLNVAVYGLNAWMRRRSRKAILVVIAVSAISTAVLSGYIYVNYDAQMAQNHPGTRLPSFYAGKMLTRTDVIRLLGAEPGSGGTRPLQKNVDLMRDSLHVDWFFIASYVVLIASIGALLREPRLFAGIAILLAVTDSLENLQALVALDPPTTPVLWWAKVILIAIVVVAALGLGFAGLLRRRAVAAPVEPGGSGSSLRRGTST